MAKAFAGGSCCEPAGGWDSGAGECASDVGGCASDVAGALRGVV